MIDVVHYRDKAETEQLPPLVCKMVRVAQIDKSIAVCLDSLERIESQKYRTTSSLTGMPRGGMSGSKDNVIYKGIALEKRLAALRDERERILLEIADDPVMETLEPEEYSVLVRKYIDGYSLRRIAYLMFLSKSTIDNRLKSALKKIDKVGQ